MASLEFLYSGDSRAPNGVDWTLHSLRIDKSNSPAGKAISRENQFNPTQRTSPCEGQCNSAPRTAPVKGGFYSNRHQHTEEREVKVCCDGELDTSFSYVDGNVDLQRSGRRLSGRSPHDPPSLGSPNEILPDGLQELSMMSDEEFASDASGKVDYGFISAVTFLVTGISLVVVSYAVPREVTANPQSVSAREMERLEYENARVGAHLDRCVIAGLCFLTLGGVVLSTLLMISLWKGEMYRRKAFAYSKHSAKLYGSVNLRMKASPNHASCSISLDEENIDTLN